MAVAQLECHVCGASNAQGVERCQSCGARLSELAVELTEEERYARRHQPDEFEFRWVLISFALFLSAAALVLGVLPLLVPAYDPQGFPGVVITIALWFFGSAVINYVSSGKRFLEPPTAGLLAAIPTMFYLSIVADVYRLSGGAYVLGALMATMMALMGAFVGFLIRGDRPAPRSETSRRSSRPKTA